VFAPRVAIGICLIGASGGVILLGAGVPYASLTAIAIGLALGAELDLLGFLVARYFRLEEFGRIYGWQYGAFILASGLGPLWVGAVRDATGSYAPALVASSVGLVLTCIGFLALPRYPATQA
jgi:cyanate permease